MEKENNYLFEGASIFYSTEDSFDNEDKWLNYLCRSFKKFLINEFDYQKDMNVNISLVDDEQIKQINHEHRNKDYVTDVLSFPLQDNFRNGEYDDFCPVLEIGDIIIANGVCQKQANEFKITFAEEFCHLAIHGFLHLLGYDHEISEDEEKIMNDFEEKIIEILKKEKGA
ncbi:MAG: rRNA maturation RNase YbeY [Bacteriovoracaceae bacterium]|jgi:probable rRNA maturation factor|nr:rRNA maturation RNase YbeY [Bacteriovoracaceae bacterium]